MEGEVVIVVVLSFIACAARGVVAKNYQNPLLFHRQLLASLAVYLHVLLHRALEALQVESPLLLLQALQERCVDSAHLAGGEPQVERVEGDKSSAVQVKEVEDGVDLLDDCVLSDDFGARGYLFESGLVLALLVSLLDQLVLLGLLVET